MSKSYFYLKSLAVKVLDEFNLSTISIILFLALLYLSGCTASRPAVTQKPSTEPISTSKPNTSIGLPEKSSNASFYNTYELTLKEGRREFRGIWIATLANIDWPKSGMDSWEKQKSDFIALLDYYQNLNFNAVIVQVRTAGDAFYPSRFAPWSKYLTGQQGKKPNTTEDPLSWMILQAHQRGMEFHAWLNPYRATFDLATDQLSPQHDFYKHPDWMIKYGNKYYYNPGIPEVRKHLTNIIQEVVQNYDIDAIHFDDYFYPYKVEKEIFRDQDTYKKFAQGQSLEDWRRNNVNLLIKEVHQTIIAQKPWVQFGISPFGVWRNKDKDQNGSNTRAGVTNYDDLFADPITWMKNGWIDYIIPQLYWSMDYNLAAHRELVSWWARNSHQTKIYIGNSPYKIRDNADKAWDNPSEISNQIEFARNFKEIAGNAFFSANSLYTKNKDVANLVKKENYRFRTLTPHFISKSTNNFLPSPKAELQIEHGIPQLFLPFAIDPQYRFALVYSTNDLNQVSQKTDGIPFKKIYLNDRNKNLIILDQQDLSQQFLVLTFMDRFGRESKAQVFELLKKL
ncbi:Uncharacterized lipoprotein YddW, UPF0748 family [Belliella buryatensis]|uniref:Uncharacterized lipoprotein YddW, UPF0748 family n=1 Tax=Belliella buryatensis TaxID=1500549 RepID=A0A239CR17_9BACT|nr:family 10 glycosylhydrolase [Belliella buryatensis]SNS22706.1 Uncharacterized lipoprotein YddW, UPF0748 family [Belliella buryatensis]